MKKINYIILIVLCLFTVSVKAETKKVDLAYVKGPGDYIIKTKCKTKHEEFNNDSDIKRYKITMDDVEYPAFCRNPHLISAITYETGDGKSSILIYQKLIFLNHIMLVLQRYLKKQK